MQLYHLLCDTPGIHAGGCIVGPEVAKLSKVCQKLLVFTLLHMLTSTSMQCTVEVGHVTIPFLISVHVLHGIFLEGSTVSLLLEGTFTQHAYAVEPR